jgi:hypothetical protein
MLLDPNLHLNILQEEKQLKTKSKRIQTDFEPEPVPISARKKVVDESASSGSYKSSAQGLIGMLEGENPNIDNIIDKRASSIANVIAQNKLDKFADKFNIPHFRESFGGKK